MVYDWSTMTEHERDQLVSTAVMREIDQVEHYSNDILAAWKIVGQHLSVGPIFLRNLNQSSFTIPWDVNLKWVYRIFTDKGIFGCYAATAPAAICLTSLKHCGVDIVFPHHSLSTHLDRSPN